MNTIPMKNKISFLLFFVLLGSLLSSSPLWAEEMTYYLPIEKNYRPIEMEKWDDLTISTSCRQSLKRCLSHFKRRKYVSLRKGSFVANPASEYCVIQKGKPITLRDERGNEYAFCLFDLDFYVDAWDLFYKFRVD